MASIENRLFLFSSFHAPSRIPCRSGSLAALLLAMWLPLGVRADLTNVPVVALGLTNVPIGGSRLDVLDGGILFVDEPGLGGVSVQLGEADSGVFLYPLTGYVYPGDTMEGKAYGRVAGVTNRFISSVHGIHDGLEASGTVTVNFSALGATRLSVFVDSVFLGRISNSSAPIQIWGNGEGCRANPWWRLPDGSYGAVVELAYSAGRISIPLSETQTADVDAGATIFVRPDDPTNSVDYVSRVDVSATGFSSFCLTDARVGVFHHKHKALGQATLYPSGGRLVVGNLVSNIEDGVFIELPRVSACDVDLEPVELPGTNSTILVSGYGTAAFEPFTALGTAQIDNLAGTLRIGVYSGLSGLSQKTDIEIRSNGVPVASILITNGDSTVSLSGTPRLSGVSIFARTPEMQPGFGVRVDRPTTFTLAGGQHSFHGDEVRLLAGEPVIFESLESLVLVALNVPSFTITNEQPSFASPPVLSASRGTNGVTLTWPDPNQLYLVEATSRLLDGFELVDGMPEFDGTHGSLTVAVHPAPASQFFRLRKRED